MSSKSDKDISKQLKDAIVTDTMNIDELKDVLKKLKLDPKQMIEDLSVLMYAQLYCHDGALIEVTEMLLKAGADPKIVDESGNNVLILECLDGSNNEDLVRLYLDHGVDVNAQNVGGNTALINECYRDDARNRVISTLIDGGADINIKNECGDTALNAVVRSRYKRISTVQILIDNGADLNNRGELLNTALIDACGYPKQHYSEDYDDDDDGGLQVLQELNLDRNPADSEEDSEYTFDSGSSTGLNEKNENIIFLLLENGANPNIQNQYGQTALHKAIENYHPSIDVIKALMKHGAKIGTRDFRDRTPLEYAVFYGYNDIFDVLKNHK